jgi:3-hydroxyisobutyrate dehydrogenase-like beta-hydroxyacid dehydrogenase
MTAEAAITVGFVGLGNMGMTKAISAGQSSSITSELSK